MSLPFTFLSNSLNQTDKLGKYDWSFYAVFFFPSPLACLHWEVVNRKAIFFNMSTFTACIKLCLGLIAQYVRLFLKGLTMQNRHISQPLISIILMTVLCKIWRKKPFKLWTDRASSGSVKLFPLNTLDSCVHDDAHLDAWKMEGGGGGQFWSVMGSVTYKSMETCRCHCRWHCRWRSVYSYPYYTN